MSKSFLWVEKFAPNTVQDCILPDRLIKGFEQYLTEGNLQNMIFHSSPGTGKTSCALTIPKQIGADYILINGSDEGRFLGTARDKVGEFASSLSMFNPDVPKVVIYDEFDNTPMDVQLLLRGSINQFQDNCRFIFTGNNLSKITDALYSRCAMFNFTPTPDERMKMGKKFFERCKEILLSEGITFEESALAKFIMSLAPDYRRVLNELQSYSMINKTIDVGILSVRVSGDLKILYDAIINRSYKKARMWLIENKVGSSFFGEMQDYLIEHAKGELVPACIVTLARYQHWSVSAFNLELNASACIVELMRILNGETS